MKMSIRAHRPVSAVLLAFAALLAVQSPASAVFVSSTADAYAVSSTLTTSVAGVVTSAAIPNAFEVMSVNPPGSTLTTGAVRGFGSLGRNYFAMTLEALGPLGESTNSNSTGWPSSRFLKPPPAMLV